jgi:hypothetical protein
MPKGARRTLGIIKSIGPRTKRYIAKINILFADLLIDQPPFDPDWAVKIVCEKDIILKINNLFNR